MNRDAPAIVAGADEISYRQLEERVTAATARLRTLGIGRGMRVGLWADNSVEWVVIALAVARAGGVLVPLNTRLAPAEVAWQVQRADLRLLLAGEVLAPHAPPGCRVVALGEWRRVAQADGTPAPGHDDPAREAAIVFTSGTTGRPKGAVLTRGNELASARAAASVLPLAPGDRWLASLPFFHVGGLGIIQRCLLAGACIVLPRSFAAADLRHSVEREGVTHLSLVEATLRRLLEAAGGGGLPATLRAAVVGGGPVGEALLAACPQALATYGLTETCSMVTLVRPGAPPSRRRGAGEPLPGIALRIAPDGIIEVRGAVVMRGYLDDAQATGEALHDGWLRTGDLGEIDAQGCLHVLSRRHDLIISGGENVYPAEIEHALGEHPDVADAVVVGVDDAQWGQAPLALVVLRQPGTPDLRAFLAPRLARYKLPRITFVAEIPRLANGKPDRETLRAWVATGAQTAAPPHMPHQP